MRCIGESGSSLKVKGSKRSYQKCLQPTASSSSISIMVEVASQVSKRGQTWCDFVSIIQMEGMDAGTEIEWQMSLVLG